MADKRVDKRLKVYTVFSPATRIAHWVMAVAIFVLFFTGLYIGDPFFQGSIGEPTFAVFQAGAMEMIRYVHFLFAYLLLAAMLLRLYGLSQGPGDRLWPRFWTRGYWDGLWDTTLHYLFLRAQHRPYLRNSLARTGYAAIYLMIFAEIVTGYAMYVMIAPNSISARILGQVHHLLINEYTVHLIHHYIAWGMMLFVIVHIYMVFRADIMEKGGEVSGIVSGVKIYEQEPEDLGDLK